MFLVDLGEILPGLSGVHVALVSFRNFPVMTEQQPDSKKHLLAPERFKWIIADVLGDQK